MADLEGRMFIKRPDKSFAPADAHAEAMADSVTDGKAVLLTFRKPRHPENHAHFFAVLHIAYTHMEAYNDEDVLLDAVKIAVGHTKAVQRTTGEIVFIPKSIDFASMPEDQFRRFKNRAFFVLERLTGIPIDTLIEEAAASRRRVKR